MDIERVQVGSWNFSQRDSAPEKQTVVARSSEKNRCVSQSWKQPRHPVAETDRLRRISAQEVLRFGEVVHIGFTLNGAPFAVQRSYKCKDSARRFFCNKYKYMNIGCKREKQNVLSPWI
ncbi:uncharacterized protein LOC109504300 isoform X2 [Harpegnathos saltator]|uniref:uncharacterized protein LOC109504300 isoform X2 n=1 Tax=Harpegnathos saltator TaxID=610380 RepID=UPI000DBEE93C|nr:uncharacterized protein LOC109504300 isoform X2 [Harpegnathos saltator]